MDARTAQKFWNEMPRIHVLVADPDENLLAEYREQLPDDIHLATAVNGLDCVTQLRRSAPDVLVLEPNLPWGGGDGVLALLREIPRSAMLPVMILTDCRDVRVLQSVAAFPICDYRVKPLTPSHLATRIRNVLIYRKRRDDTALSSRFARSMPCVATVES